MQTQSYSASARQTSVRWLRGAYLLVICLLLGVISRNLFVRKLHNDLLAAIQRGDAAGVQAVLARGIAPDSARDADGFTALAHALECSDQGFTPAEATTSQQAGRLKAALLLVNAGADPNTVNAFGLSALYVAGACEDKTLFQALLDRGATLRFNAKNAPLGSHPVLMAPAVHGNTEWVKMLLAQGVDPNERDAHGETPLMWAVVSHVPDCIETLLRAGADPNARTGAAGGGGITGSRPTLLMCYSSTPYTRKDHPNSEILGLLVRYGADVNLPDADGNTPLMSFFDANSVRILLAHHANLKARNKQGRTALSLARHGRNQEVVRLLQQAGAKE